MRLVWFALRSHLARSAASRSPGAAPASSGDAGAVPAGTPPVVRSAPRAGLDLLAETMFRKHDVNGDGFLNHDEMPENLRAELEKWDTDKNGLIDLGEFKAWLQARAQFVVGERHAGDVSGLQLRPDNTLEGKRVGPYRDGKLPSELPAWFIPMDTDHDGQIGLYEWKTSGRPLEEFDAIDRNGDGFLTVDEVLRYEAMQRSGAQRVRASGQGAALSRPASGRAGVAR
jgi:Ca2+-binding EF-hand superfamily protein